MGNTQERFEALAVDEVSLRDREKQLREQVEILNEENSKFIYENDTNVNKIRSLQVELSGVRKDFQNINDENSRLKDQLKLSTSDISQFRNTADSDSFSLKAVEEKTNLLVKEKKELESLLSRLQRAVPSQDLQRIFLDIMKTHSDLEISHRERLRIENQLLRSEAEMRSLARSVQQEKSFQTRKEVESLRIQLNNCDSQIQSYKRRMFNLEEELKELETIERRRFAMNLDTERSFGNSQLRFSNEKTETKHNFDPEMSFNHQETRFTESPMPHFDKLRRSNYDL